jgi:hypothetical protein
MKRGAGSIDGRSSSGEGLAWPYVKEVRKRAMKAQVIRRSVTRAALAAAVAATMVQLATGQSVNIDLDVPGSPEGGGGVPAASFSGAASQPGVWNRILAHGMVDTQLFGLDGQLTSIIMSGPPGGSSLGFNNPLNSGDFSKLLNDARHIISDTYTFSGLVPGLYKLFTLFTSGSMPGNQFILGRTHVIHEFSVTSGTFSVEIAMGSQTNSFLNGFQLQFVPEPTVIVGLTSGLLFLIGRKRRSN